MIIICRDHWKSCPVLPAMWTTVTINGSFMERVVLPANVPLLLHEWLLYARVSCQWEKHTTVIFYSRNQCFLFWGFKRVLKQLQVKYFLSWRWTNKELIVLVGQLECRIVKCQGRMYDRRRNVTVLRDLWKRYLCVTAVRGWVSDCCISLRQQYCSYTTVVCWYSNDIQQRFPCRAAVTRDQTSHNTWQPDTQYLTTRH